MAKLYKGKKTVDVPHEVDIREWEKDGWSRIDPEKEKVPAEKMTQEEFDEVKDNLASLKADELRRVAEFTEVEYTNIPETVAAIKTKFEIE